MAVMATRACTQGRHRRSPGTPGDGTTVLADWSRSGGEPGRRWHAEQGLKMSTLVPTDRATAGEAASGKSERSSAVMGRGGFDAEQCVQCSV